jgi:hypothetical protein
MDADPSRKQPRAIDARPEHPVLARHGHRRVGERRKPCIRGRRKPRREQVLEVADQVAIPTRRTKHEQASNGSMGIDEFLLDRRRFVAETAHCVAAVGEQVLDFDDRDLAPKPALKVNINRPRSTRIRVDRPLGSGTPSATRGSRDHELLATEMLDVPGQCCSGHRFHEGSQLHRDGSRARREGLEGGGRSLTPFDLTPECLRDAGAVGCFRLGESESRPTFPKRHADSLCEVSAPAPTNET